jgi:hypothetical protein
MHIGYIQNNQMQILLIINNLGSTMLHMNSDDIECRMWNVGWCIEWKVRIGV